MSHPHARRAALPDLLVFASGSNRPSEIAGFGAVGHHVGVAAPEVRPAAEAALLALPPSIHVFLDSGAYSEVEIPKAGPPRVVAPITPIQWDQRLRLYERLATVLGPRLHVVAPDFVTRQGETLERLRTYAPRMRAIAATGAEVLVPLQPGELSFTDFERACGRVLGWDGFVPAIPMRQKATQILTLLEWLGERQPARVHLLGLGEHNRETAGILEAIRRASPGTVVSMDANRLAAASGRQDAQPRPLTAASDTLIARGAAERFGDEYQEMIYQPSHWLTRDALKALAADAGMGRRETAAFLRDPDGYLADSEPEDRAYLDHELDKAWARQALALEGAERRQEAVEMAFGPELRTRSPNTLMRALYQAATAAMMRGGTTELVELLDVPEFYAQASAAVDRALKPRVVAPIPLVLACSATKRPGRLPAIDKYDGPLWRTLRAHRGAFARPVWVLSAEHGLVPADTPMDDYDRRIVQGRPGPREVTPAQLAPLIAEQARAAGFRSVDFVGGLAYVEALNMAGLEVNRVSSDGIGYQRQALAVHLRAGGAS